MRFIETAIEGVYLIGPEPKEDARGNFARIFCEKEFAEHGLETRFVQANHSFSKKRGTLRGMHYQLAPAQETKLVQCFQGAVYDIVLDLREESATFGRSIGATLSLPNRKMMYVPKGCAHGFLTLEDESAVFYLVSRPYAPELERGVRWNDPRFSMTWPFEPLILSERDREHPDYLQEKCPS